MPGRREVSEPAIAAGASPRPHRAFRPNRWGMGAVGGVWRESGGGGQERTAEREEGGRDPGAKGRRPSP